MFFRRGKVREEHGAGKSKLWVGWGSARTGAFGVTSPDNVSPQPILAWFHAARTRASPFSRPAFSVSRCRRPRIPWSTKADSLGVTAQARATREARFGRGLTLPGATPMPKISWSTLLVPSWSRT